MNTIGEIQGFHPEVFELDQRLFPWPWTKEDWEKLDEFKKLYGFWVSGKLQGFCLIHHMPGDDSLHLLKIAIEPALRGSAESEVFWENLLKEFKKLSLKVFLEVESSNERALGFYRKKGFLPLRLMKRYYSNGSDGWSMELTL